MIIQNRPNIQHHRKNTHNPQLPADVAKVASFYYYHTYHFN